MRHRGTLARHLPLALVAASLTVVATPYVFGGGPFESPEVHFADASPSGLTIVPASCPSQPDLSCPPVVTLSQNKAATAPLESFVVTYGYSSYSPSSPGLPPTDGTKSTISCTLQRQSPGGSFTTISTTNNTSLAVEQSLVSPLGTWVYRAQCSFYYWTSNHGLHTGPSVGYTEWVYLDHEVTDTFSGEPDDNDVCTDIPNTQLEPPPGCQQPSPSPGQCIPEGYVYDTSEGECVSDPLWPGNGNGNGSGDELPPSIESFYASPVRVRSGESSVLFWSVENPPEFCSITGTNGFFATISGSSGSIPTNAISARTTFTLNCSGITASVVVNLIPVFQEL